MFEQVSLYLKPKMKYAVLSLAIFMIIIFTKKILINITHIHLFTVLLLLNNLKTFKTLIFYCVANYFPCHKIHNATTYFTNFMLFTIARSSPRPPFHASLKLAESQIVHSTTPFLPSSSLFLCIRQGHKDSTQHY